MRILLTLLLLTLQNLQAMKLPPLYEIQIDPVYIDYSERDTEEHVAALISRQSNEMNMRNPEFDALCKQRFGTNFRFSSVVERQEERSTSNIFFDLLGIGDRRITLYPSILCLPVTI